MSIPENEVQLQLLIISYLYGDMSAAEMRQFEQQLESSPALQKLLAEEQELNIVFPPGMQPRIDEERRQANRRHLRHRLQSDGIARPALGAWLQGLRERPLVVAVQAAVTVIAFVAGVLIATPGDPQQPLAEATPGGASPLQLIGDDDYEIYRMTVNDYDAASGAIDLSFALASETRLAGKVTDRDISQLMAVALQQNIDSAARLDTIHALQPVAFGNPVYDALIHVLKNDRNPGVRYHAVQLLVTLAEEERVRDALRFALREDVNQGVRVEAFNALLDYRDDATLAVFREQMERDSNEYIRTRARSIVAEFDAGDRVL